MFKMEVLLIHNYPHLLDQCCDFINKEWPRSRTARLRTLQASCNNLPTCLVLVHKDEILGHSKISRIPSLLDGCFVESVMIHPHFRGKGLGKLLMTRTEEYAKSLGIWTVYLSTTDQQGFYERLGYVNCSPVSIYGCNATSGYREDTSRLCMNTSGRTSTPVIDLNDGAKENYKIPTPPPPPPPPPPPLPHQQNSQHVLYNTPRKTYMKKELKES